MFLELINEIHVTTVHTSDSGDVLFPDWDRSNWYEEIIEKVDSDERNEFETTYSLWKKK